MYKNKPIQLLLLFFLIAALSFCGAPQKKKNTRKSYRNSSRSSYNNRHYSKKRRYSRTRNRTYLNMKDSTTRSLLYNMKSYQRSKRLSSVRELGNREGDKNKIVIPLAYAMSDSYRAVRDAAFNSLKKLDEGDLAEALRQSYSTYGIERGFSKVLEIKDPRILRVYQKNLSGGRTTYARHSADGIRIILGNRETALGFGMDDALFRHHVKESAKGLIYIHSRTSGKTKEAVERALIDLGKPAHIMAIKELKTYKNHRSLQIQKMILDNLPAFTPAINEILNRWNHPATKNILSIVHLLPGVEIKETVYRRLQDGTLKPTTEIIKFLGRTGTEKSRNILTELHNRKGFYYQKSLIIKELGKMGSPDSIPLFINNIEGTDPNSKLSSVVALGVSGNRLAVPPLIALLEKEKNIRVQKKIIQALARLNARRAVPAMKRAAQKNSTLREALIRVVPLMPDRRFLPLIEEEMTPEKTYRYQSSLKYNNCEKALVAIGPASISLCRRIIRNKTIPPQHKSKEAAITALGKIGSKSTIPLLLSQLKRSKKATIRIKIRQALGEIGSPAVIPALFKKINTSKESVKKSLILMGKPAIPRLKYYVKKGKTSAIKNVAAGALTEIYNAYTSYRKGNLLFKMEKYGPAATAYADALRRKPNLHEAQINLGVCKYHQKNYDMAIRSFRNVAEEYPKLRAEAEMNLGAALQRKGNTGLARVHTARARQIKKRLAGAHYNHGWIHDETGNLASAKDDLNRALRINRSHAKALITRASVNARKGLPASALADLKKAEGYIGSDDEDLREIIEKNKLLLEKTE